MKKRGHDRHSRPTLCPGVSRFFCPHHSRLHYGKRAISAMRVIDLDQTVYSDAPYDRELKQTIPEMYLQKSCKIPAQLFQGDTNWRGISSKRALLANSEGFSNIGVLQHSCFFESLGVCKSLSEKVTLWLRDASPSGGSWQSWPIAAAQPVENQQRSYEVFGTKHYRECPAPVLCIISGCASRPGNRWYQGLKTALIYVLTCLCCSEHTAPIRPFTPVYCSYDNTLFHA